MSAACATPIPFDLLADYWAGDLAADESDRIEEHLISCAACTAASARVASMANAVRNIIPPFVSEATVAELRARGLRIRDNPLTPGTRKLAVFTDDIDLLIHRLSGLDLAAADQVRVKLFVEETRQVILDERVPFDRAKGEVLIACQRHFAAFPPNIVAEVFTSDAPGAEPVAVYSIPHVFEAAR